MCSYYHKSGAYKRTLHAKNIIYTAAQKGELDKTKTELLKNLPELTEIIRKESNHSEILEINSAAKKILQKQKEQQQKIAQQIENYKKEHPILSKFYIPKFK